ncbi:MAG: bifunctional UDP-N-acetylglucosamine diphosphorylase/glucosamine-1-phosphate N-acetyltransferase GlmU [Bifidobacteriaceae bacterium]|jgi:bifunctional UDP-N-acetylglucosamine pyrophosphorylase/glucosamine-1-phosphate N-acetyltransferase|nr:bifunctional UDP-N-acetylglucosamine diphosphorylase/glucosamine-1-phosphate N-acetyltransferase GlmU [Bifidobacteriaceae bacterium]
MTQPAVIVLAAGEGVRMRSATPKVLHKVAGLTLLGHAFAAARGADPALIAVVVRHERDLVAAHAHELDPDALIVDQDDVPGTGRAVQCALAALDRRAAPPVHPDAPCGPVPHPAAPGHPAPAATQGLAQVMVIPGDAPRITAEVLAALAEAHAAQGNAITVLTAALADPCGYGRVIRDPDGQVARIVEDRDATSAERLVNEVNSSVYVFDAATLRQGLAGVGRDNAQGQIYLTDVIEAARRAGTRVGALTAADPSVIEGVNDRAQLARAARAINQRIVHEAMLCGVTVIDPDTTWIDRGVELASDVTLMPGTHLQGRTAVAAGARIGPFATLVDTTVGPGAVVDRTVATGAEIGPGAQVGPFTHLRPGTRLGVETKAGSFTELKAADVADRAKVPHLSYVGDAVIGEATNVGAGTIFANYDGVAKSRSEIGPAARIGSNSTIVAPVTLGAGAYTGAGAVVRGHVPPGALALSAGPQRVIEGWTSRKRAGSASAEAARHASAASPPPDAVLPVPAPGSPVPTGSPGAGPAAVASAEALSQSGRPGSAVGPAGPDVGGAVRGARGLGGRTESCDGDHAPGGARSANGN